MTNYKRYCNYHGKDSIFILTQEQIKKVPKDWVISYARTMDDYWWQKEDPNHVHLTAGGNLFSFPDELLTHFANITTAKILWNNVLSMPKGKYVCVDNKIFYLGTELDCFEYAKIPLNIFPEHTIKQYNLYDHKKHGFVCHNLKSHFAPHKLASLPYTRAIETCHQPIAFTLVIDDFGIKYTNKRNTAI